MMKVIDKQFTKEILLSTAFVLVALVALFAFFDLINQMEDVGTEYTLGTAFFFFLLTLPSRIYEVMPLAVLLAAVYTMARWAAKSEFTVLRVAGMSPVRLARALLLPGVLLVVLTYGFGEVVAPWAARYTIEVKSGDKNDTVSARGYVSGVWVRDLAQNHEGKPVDRYINVKNLSASNMSETGAWRMFEFNREGKLLRMIHADSASFHPGKGWQLHKAVTVTYPAFDPKDTKPIEAKIITSAPEELYLETTVGPEILGVMTTKPENMSMRDLDRYLAHITKTNQQAEHYQIAFWSKATYPLAIIVMLALSMPFAYLNARSGGVAVKIFLGVMIGIAFYALNNLFSYLGIVNTWSPIAVSITPSAVMLLLAALALCYVERR